MKVKHYLIEAAGSDPVLMRGTAKKVQAAVRALHATGVPAQCRCLTNKAERNFHMEAAQAVAA